MLRVLSWAATQTHLAQGKFTSVLGTPVAQRADEVGCSEFGYSDCGCLIRG
jgi:hypothetical protein